MDAAFRPRKPFEVLAFPERIFAYGFSLRKRDFVRKCLGTDRIVFTSDGKSIAERSALLLWGRAALPEALPEQVQIIRIEDGFLRSVGLGADLIQPVSWVIDASGIYFDATQSSDLEVILQTYSFDDALLARADKLRQKIIDSGITKYNVGAESWTLSSKNKKTILVPGQVETDASIQYGALGINTNIDLLKSVRRENPDVHIIYKPHPDVMAGLRAQGKSEHEAGDYCDEVVTDVPMDDLLTKVDEVHVLTSLSGFEALLRGKSVICYGLPFYAGWGLTRDHLDCPRRTRTLSLSMLTAAALILYPTYISRQGGVFITPEQALEELIAWRQKTKVLPWYARLWRDFMRRVLSRP